MQTRINAVVNDLERRKTEIDKPDLASTPACIIQYLLSIHNADGEVQVGSSQSVPPTCVAVGAAARDPRDRML